MIARLAALLCLVAGCAAAVEGEDDDMGSYQIPYGSSGGSVQLQGNASQIITLDNTNPTEVQWSPVDRRAIDVEVRVYFYQMQGLTEDVISLGCPVIRWGMRNAHGSLVIDEPANNFPLQPGTFDAFGDTMPRVALPVMPGRGLHFRTTTRELTLLLQNTGYGGAGYKLREALGGIPSWEVVPGVPIPTFPPVTMAVSFQPVEGLEVPVLPRFIQIDPSGALAPPSGPPILGTREFWGNYLQLPAAATEWRAMMDNGKPVPWQDLSGDPNQLQIEAVNAIRFIDPIGHQVGEFLPWEIDEDFISLPPRAWGVYRVPTNPDFPDITANELILEFR